MVVVVKILSVADNEQWRLVPTMSFANSAHSKWLARTVADMTAWISKGLDDLISHSSSHYDVGVLVLRL